MESQVCFILATAIFLLYMWALHFEPEDLERRALRTNKLAFAMLLWAKVTIMVSITMNLRTMVTHFFNS